jgi:hypothetical protein
MRRPRLPAHTTLTMARRRREHMLLAPLTSLREATPQ